MAKLETEIKLTDLPEVKAVIDAVKLLLEGGPIMNSDIGVCYYCGDNDDHQHYPKCTFNNVRLAFEALDDKPDTTGDILATLEAMGKIDESGEIAKLSEFTPEEIADFIERMGTDTEAQKIRKRFVNWFNGVNTDSGDFNGMAERYGKCTECSNVISPSLIDPSKEMNHAFGCTSRVEGDIAENKKQIIGVREAQDLANEKSKPLERESKDTVRDLFHACTVFMSYVISDYNHDHRSVETSRLIAWIDGKQPQYTLEQAKEVMCEIRVSWQPYGLGGEVILHGVYSSAQLRLIAWIKENNPSWMNDI